jgi:hypothetical protein
MSMWVVAMWVTRPYVGQLALLQLLLHGGHPASVIVSSAPTTVPPRVHPVTRHAALHAYQEHLNSNDRLVKRNASIYLSTGRWILEWYRGLMRLKLKW